MRSNAIVKLSDIFIVIAALFLAAVLFFVFVFGKNASGETVAVSINGQTEYYKTDTDRTIEIESNGYHLTVEISDKKVRIAYSDCPDKLCVNTGFISNGQSIVCIPANVIVSYSGETEVSDVDAVTG